MTAPPVQGSEAKAHFKILLFMKRHPDLTHEAFVEYYETKHVPLVLNYSSGLKTYTRRYLTPHTHVETGDGSDFGFDVITELGFADKKTRDGTLKYLAENPLPDIIIEDEKKLFDRKTFRVVTCTEFTTAL